MADAPSPNAVLASRDDKTASVVKWRDGKVNDVASDGGDTAHAGRAPPSPRHRQRPPRHGWTWPRMRRWPAPRTNLRRAVLFSVTTVWALWWLWSLSQDGDDGGDGGHGAAGALPCTEATFAEALPAGTAWVERVDAVRAGGSYGEGAANRGFPHNATNLPALCAVTVAVDVEVRGDDGAGRSRHRLALFLPTPRRWNGRLLTVGSYGFAGGINWPDMGAGPHYGFATLASDGGHSSAADVLDWAPTTPDALADWGFRALHDAVGLAKALTRHYYGAAAVAYSYYSGCSTGGRQGLREAQLDAASFDGLLVGAPAWTTSRLLPWITRIGVANRPRRAPHHLDPPAMAALAAAARAQCDARDGLRDGIISRPEQCEIDWAALECAARDGDGEGDEGVGKSKQGEQSERDDRGQTDAAPCLAGAQIETARFLYADAFTAAGDFMHSGFTVGSEDEWYMYAGVDGDDGTHTHGDDFGTRYERFWLYNDSYWDWPRYGDATFYDSLRANPGNASADRFDISAFRDRGGKVLLYQGLADAAIPPRMTTRYYLETRAAMGLDVADDDAADAADAFFRYFQVPGMQHCFGTPERVNAPWMFAAPGQAPLLLRRHGFGPGWGVPGRRPSPAHDALLALMAWVEDGAAPDRIEATSWNADGTVNRTRPLCVYPREAVYAGVGSPDVAANWACR